MQTEVFLFEIHLAFKTYNGQYGFKDNYVHFICFISTNTQQKSSNTWHSLLIFYEKSILKILQWRIYHSFYQGLFFFLKDYFKNKVRSFLIISNISLLELYPQVVYLLFPPQSDQSSGRVALHQEWLPLPLATPGNDWRHTVVTT